MKHTPRSIFYITLICGALGALLQLWFYGAREESGLLPAFHIAKVLLLILGALHLVFVILQTRKLSGAASYQAVFPASSVCAALTMLAALGLAFYGFREGFTDRSPANLIPTATCLVAAVCLFQTALCRLKGREPSFQISVILSVCAVLLGVFLGREWGRESQVIVYLFPLLAAICSMLGAYHQAAFSLQKNNLRSLQLYSQLAVFCCCLSLNSTAGVLYLSLGFWMASSCLSSQEG